MSDIVISEFMDQAAVDSLALEFDVLYDAELVGRPLQLNAALGDARALIVRNRTQVRGALLAEAKRLEVVGRLGVGLDNIDLETCRTRGIEVCSAIGANDTAVAEYVIACAMLLLRQAYSVSVDLQGGAWPRQSCIGRELAGKVMGLIGMGAIAREAARRAAALGMSVMGHDPHLPADAPVWELATRANDLRSLLHQADVVSLHVPLNEDTHHMIGERSLGEMRRDAVLINSARGGVVDEVALVAALRRGQLGGAALDVFENEPLDAASGARFAQVPNLLLTPHIAGVTQESNARVSAVTAANVRTVLARRP